MLSSLTLFIILYLFIFIFWLLLILFDFFLYISFVISFLDKTLKVYILLSLIPFKGIDESNFVKDLANDSFLSLNSKLLV